MNKHTLIVLIYVLTAFGPGQFFGGVSHADDSVMRVDAFQRKALDQTLPAPLASVDNSTFADTLRVVLSPSCEADDCSGGHIVYTLDGSDPLSSATGRLFQKPVSIRSSTLLRARFVSDSAFSRYGPELIREYRKIGKLPRPSANKPYDEFVISDTISLHVPGHGDNPRIRIYYTLDGRDPLMHGELYRKPLIISDRTTLKAVAVSGGGDMLNSPELRRHFIRIYPPLPEPVITPVDTNFETTIGATIRVPGFETDSLLTLIYRIVRGDSILSHESGSGKVKVALDSTVSIHAYAHHPGYSPSHLSVGRYVRGDTRVLSAPDAFPRGGEFCEEAVTVTLQSDDPDAMITYTLNGGEPTMADELYRGEPIVIRERSVLKARSFRTNLEPSAVQEEVYTFSRLPAPIATVEGGTVFDDSLRVALTVPGFEDDSLVRIYYSLEGLNPTDSGALYKDTITITRFTALRMFAQKPYFEPSEISSYDYYCTRMVNEASYEDRDGDGRIETATVELNGTVGQLLTKIRLTDPFSGEERIFTNKDITFQSETEGRGSIFSVSIEPPFEFGTGVALNQWGRIPLGGDFDIKPFTILDKAAPVIESARLNYSDHATRDSLFITFSEPIRRGTIRGRRPDEVFRASGPLQTYLENGGEPIGMLNDSVCLIVLSQKPGYAEISSRNSIALSAENILPADRMGNVAAGDGREVEIRLFHEKGWDVLAISPFTPGVDPIPGYVAGLPGIKGNTGTVIMISSPDMPPAVATIYDATGNVIRGRMDFVYRGADKKQYLVWDGKNSRGEVVSSGTYLVAVRMRDGNAGQSTVKYIKVAVKDN